MLSKYNPKDFEESIYKKWMDSKAFEADPASDKEKFSMVLPPPNITGRLHIGHALNHTLQDILIRYKRMAGYETLWLPGTDHASIATEVLVVRMLKETTGKSKRDFTREEFLEHAWNWREKYGREIVEQMRKLGDSCDWSKERFTMDQHCSDAVKASFIDLYEHGHIYRGNRMITWCPSCRTTISDAEIDHEERAGKLWDIKYPLADGSGYLVVATSRPETMYGDTAVAVHPDDLRYRDLIGKKLIVPVNGREVPIVTAEEIDMEFGTGALKVTPAHSEVDYNIGLRHNLPIVDAFHENGTMNEHAGKFEGLDRYECRKRVIEELKENGYLLGERETNQVVGRCDRCKTDVEPRVSDQWFVKMADLAKPALEAYQSGKLIFHPSNYAKLYVNWLENIRDWNISRQLWWGHQIPAYYCDECGEVVVAAEMPETCKCGSSHFTQDPDVLDTWFSSGLWPFSTMGWPHDTDLLRKFYPTDTLLTSYDIIPLWVVRMVFQGIEQTKQLPFKDVIINGLVRDQHGRKMSKSAGNGVDTMELIEKYGADATRFSLIHGNSMGVDSRIYDSKLESARNFANKLWNASRFVISGLDKSVEELEASAPLELADRWILTRIRTVITEVTALLDKYDSNFAAGKLYDFIWSEYCDWYIELSKRGLYSDDEQRKRTVQFVLVKVLKAILRLMHPYMPFITEEIWSNLSEDMLIRADWPKAEEFEDYGQDLVGRMELIMDAIRGIRNVRAEMNIPNSKKSVLLVRKADGSEMFQENRGYIISLANCTDVEFVDEKPEDAVLITTGGYELYLPLAELIDKEKELQRLEKEIDNLYKEIERLKAKLANEGFVAKAPAKVVEEERKKLEEYTSTLAIVQESYDKIRSQ